MTRPDSPAQKSDDLAILPERYASALRLARIGTSPVRIAEELGIPVESVAALLVLAEAKLTTMLRRAATAADEPVPARGPETSTGSVRPDNPTET